MGKKRNKKKTTNNKQTKEEKEIKKEISNEVILANHSQENKKYTKLYAIFQIFFLNYNFLHNKFEIHIYKRKIKSMLDKEQS